MALLLLSMPPWQTRAEESLRLFRAMRAWRFFRALSALIIPMIAAASFTLNNFKPFLAHRSGRQQLYAVGSSESAGCRRQPAGGTRCIVTRMARVRGDRDRDGEIITGRGTPHWPGAGRAPPS
jgi:hypothetical protein